MLILSYLVILIKHVLQGFRVSPSQLLNVIRGGMLLCEVPTRNSAPIPSSTRNMNSTPAGVVKWKTQTY